MSEGKRLLKKRVLTELPPEWPASLLSEIQKQVKSDGRSLVVLDDDPTGTQTVANLPVLTEWSVDSLCAELESEFPAFYILTNSRSVSEAEAVRMNREIGRNLVAASRITGRDFAVISRSDSTLRGHFPGEMDALTEALEQKFDGWPLIPYFLEGGRFTINDVHYVQEGDELVPAGDTPFAQDGDFGYQSSNLRDWVAEKTNGRISPTDVLSISLTDIRQGGPERISQQLQQVSGGQVIIVNAAAPRDLEVFTHGLLRAEAGGKRFLYRTAASFVQVRAGLSPQPLLKADDLGLPSTGGGLFVVGSYVPKTTQQLEALLGETTVHPIEIQVEALLDQHSRQTEIDRVVALADSLLAAGEDTAVYTSRQLVKERDGRSGLVIGQIISASLVQIVQNLATQPRYLVAKGGITSSDIAAKALAARRALVAGQILPGVPVWQMGEESRWPGLAFIIFPGNVGDDDALVKLVNQLKSNKIP